MTPTELQFIDAMNVIVECISRLTDRIERLEVEVDQLMEDIKDINSREISHE